MNVSLSENNLTAQMLDPILHKKWHGKKLLQISEYDLGFCFAVFIFSSDLFLSVFTLPATEAVTNKVFNRFLRKGCGSQDTKMYQIF